jgi:sulfur carrier protein ThiS
MQVMVKLYGTLGKRVPGYVHSEGILVEIPDTGTVEDLLFALNVSEPQNVVIAMDGRILTREDKLRDDVWVNVMQPLHGG